MAIPPLLHPSIPHPQSFYILSRALLLLNLLSGSYSTFKVLRNPSVDDRQDKLVFWSLFAFISMYDEYVERFVSWFPFYFIGKSTARESFDPEGGRWREPAHPSLPPPPPHFPAPVAILFMGSLSGTRLGRSVGLQNFGGSTLRPMLEAFVDPVVDKYESKVRRTVAPTVAGAASRWCRQLQASLLDERPIRHISPRELDRSQAHLEKWLERVRRERERREKAAAEDEASEMAKELAGSGSGD